MIAISQGHEGRASCSRSPIPNGAGPATPPGRWTGGLRTG